MTRRPLVLSVLTVLLLLAAALPSGAQPVGPAGSGRVLVFERLVDGDEDHELRWPSAVAASPDGALAVADAYQPRVYLFRETGGAWRIQKAVGLPGAPVALAWDGERFVVSLRGGEGLVALEGADLLLRKLSLPSGSVPGALAPVPGGGLLVHDPGGSRVLRLGREGDTIAEIPVDGHVSALAAGPGGGFYTALGRTGMLRRHDAGGAVEETWELPGDGPVPAWPVGLAAEPSGDLLILDRHNERVIAFDPTGVVEGFGARRGWEPGLLLFPAGITLVPGDLVAVADQGNGRVEIYQRVRQSETP
jgi:hypothetical protein